MLVAVYELFWRPLTCGAVSGTSLSTQASVLLQGLPNAGVILDAGCGTGLFARRIAEESPRRRVLGIDRSWSAIERARRVHVDGVTYVRANVHALPFSDAVADCVICAGSLHLFTDPAAALLEFSRVARPGARLRLLTYARYGRGLTVAGFRLFAIHELEDLLDHSGWEIVGAQRFGLMWIGEARSRSRSAARTLSS
jgi:ubiquinone/menaquinone biosynthesis C-methylase UbiE